MVADADDGIALPPELDFLLVAIAAGVVGGGVIAEAVGHAFDEERSSVLASQLGGLSACSETTAKMSLPSHWMVSIP